MASVSEPSTSPPPCWEAPDRADGDRDLESEPDGVLDGDLFFLGFREGGAEEEELLPLLGEDECETEDEDFDEDEDLDGEAGLGLGDFPSYLIFSLRLSVFTWLEPGS